MTELISWIIIVLTVFAVHVGMAFILEVDAMKTIRDMNKIILASASPRRRELLKQMGLEFEVIPSKVDEVITRKIPWEIVMELSSQKARDLVYKAAMDSLSDTSAEDKDAEGRDILVIGADTVVAYGDRILGKPKDKADAVEMLTLLAGKCHSVYTGVSLVYLKEGIAQTRTFVEETKVYVAPMTTEQIEAYVATGECMDKAGAYAIQGRFAEFVVKIDGDYNNVVGLPVGRIMRECIF